MALFSTAVDTCLYSFSIRRFLFRSTVAPLRCCQPKKLGASLAKLYSPKCLELDFVHLARKRRGRVRSSPVRYREVMMRTLPTTMLHLLNPFVPLFSRRLWPHVQVLLAGAILAPGKRTVSAALRVMGLGQTEHFQRYHRVLNRAVWSGRAVSHVLLGVLVRTFVPSGPLVIGVDETLERRWGKKIAAKGVYRDPVRSTQERFVKSSGLRWVCLM